MSKTSPTSSADGIRVRNAGLVALLTFLVLVVAGIAAVLGIDFDAPEILTTRAAR